MVDARDGANATHLLDFAHTNQLSGFKCGGGSLSLVVSRREKLHQKASCNLWPVLSVVWALTRVKVRQLCFTDHFVTLGALEPAVCAAGALSFMLLQVFVGEHL